MKTLTAPIGEVKMYDKNKEIHPMGARLDREPSQTWSEFVAITASPLGTVL